MAPEETHPSICLNKFLNLFEIQHVLLWKERPVAQSRWDERPAVSTQCQALMKKHSVMLLVPLYR